jgi:hypothetical protein
MQQQERTGQHTKKQHDFSRSQRAVHLASIASRSNRRR